MVFRRFSPPVLVILVSVLFVLAAKPSTAAILSVPSQYATIGAAVSAASSGDTISIDPAQGPYSAGGDLNLQLSKSLTFESSTSTTAVIDCGAVNQFIQSTSGTVDLTFHGLTVRNCQSTAISLNTSSSATFDSCVFTTMSGQAAVSGSFTGMTITKCTFSNNSNPELLEFTGGSGTLSITNSTFSGNSDVCLYSNGLTGTISNCTFSNDGSSSGNGPIVWLNGPLTITGTSFAGNKSNGGGGAIVVDSAGINSPLTLNRCTFTGNSTSGGLGGAVWLFEGDHNIAFTAEDCVFVNNSASTDGSAIGTSTGVGAGSVTITNCSFYGNSGTASGQGTISADSVTPLTITNSILYGDSTPKEISTANVASSTSVSHSLIDNAGTYASNGTNGNIVGADPMYAAAGSGDLHITNASPCVQAGIATGAPSTDFDQYAWGSTVSMGAFSPIHFALSTPSSATKGASFPFTVTATAADNTTTITNYAGTVHFSSSDVAASLPSDSTLASGTGSFNATLNTLGSQTITAADTSTAAYTSTSAGITVAGPATHFVVTAPATSTAGSSFSVTVTAEDAGGNTVGGYSGTVHFTSSDAAASLPADATLTNGTGTFSATLDTAGSQTITATDTVTSSITGSTGAITVSPAATAAFRESLPGSVTAGTPFSMTVTAVDAFGNVTPSYSGTIHYTASDPQAVLPPDGGLTNGVGTVSVTFKTEGWNNVQLRDTVNGVSGGTPNIFVNPAPVSHFTIVAPSPVTAGSSQNITVTALDPYGNQASSNTVHFSSTDRNATLPADTQISGQQTYSVTFASAGTQTITVTDTTDATITGTSNTVTVDPGPTVRLAVSAPSTSTAGAALNFTVTAQDAFGNTTPAYSGTVHFTSSDTSAVLPVDSTLTSGTGTFSATLDTAGNQRITGTDTATSSITGTSTTIAVAAATATHLTVSAPSTATAGTPFNVTVTALDQFNNIATGYTGTVHFTSSDGAAVLSADAALTNGAGTFPVTLRTAGIQTATATDTVDASLTATTSGITVSPAAATRFAVTAPSTTTAGSSISFTVEAFDAFGNVATNYNGTVRVSSTDLKATLPTNTVLPAGIAVLNATLKTSGSQTITVTDVNTSSITGTSSNITVASAPAVSLAILAPLSATSDVPFNFTIQALDAYGNTATGYSGTIHFVSRTDPLAVLPADSTVAGGLGTFTATLRTPGSNETISAADTTTSTISGVSTPVTVSANNQQTFPTGWQMISAPADFTGFGMSQIFTPAPAAVDVWNPSTMSYAVAPTAPADTIRPGIGYWAHFTQSTTMLDIGVHTDPTKAYTVALSAGWNMIGDPFNVPVTLTTGVTVTSSTVDAASFYFAGHNGLLSPYLYTFPAGATAYTIETSTLQPYAGYWIYADVPCTLSITTK